MEYFLLDDLHETVSEVCGCAMLNPGWRHMARKLDRDSVLILGRKNTTIIVEEGVELEVRPGRLTLLAAHRFHEGQDRIRVPVSYYWVHFHQPALPVPLAEAQAWEILAADNTVRQRLSQSALVPQWWDLADPEPWYHRFQALLREHHRGTYTDLRYQGMVQDLLIEMTQALVDRAGKAGLRPPLVQDILLALEEDLSNPDLSVKQIAGRLDKSADYLGRTFRVEMGVSIGQHIIERRVELARIRLRESAEPLGVVAAQCGFGSIRQFHQHFKAVEGCTPGLFRSRANAIDINGL